ncbi:MAG: PLP-dependent aminotransferase family protein [Chloroflexi bacterium]|nr:MAG: PLP-dependent aminotransferase family protein [Chloroflexota bacterium]
MHRRNHTLRSGLTSVIPLAAATDIPLRRQLYQGLRRAIVSHQLVGGTRLPSSRALAAELRLSRTTVVEAYQQLLLEGYLEGRRGSGTYVSSTIPDVLLAPASAPHRQVERAIRASPPSQLHGGGSAPATAGHSPAYPAFRVGQPALEAFPHVIWQRLLARRYRESWQELFGYQDAAGYRRLREAIAAYLGVARGVRCIPEQVIVTAGAQQALDLIARLVLKVGDAVWVEDPGYFGARWAFQGAGLRLIPTAVDSDGFDVAAGQSRYPDARLAYVTPSHQFPLGATMSLERRLALLTWAKDREGWIVEDDYDSEYRYAGRPLPAMQGLDDAGRVLYVGTFSKMLFPSLRLGYLVVPPTLVKTLVTAPRHAELHASVLEQAVVADFMAQGHFERHIRCMRALYAQRQAILREAIGQHMPGMLEVHPAAAGMHLVAWLPSEVKDCEPIVRAARDHHIETLPLTYCSMRPLRRQALVLGYAAADEGQIVEGVRTLRRVVDHSLTEQRNHQTVGSRTLSIRGS